MNRGVVFQQTLARALSVALADYLTEISKEEKEENTLNLLLLFLTLKKHSDSWAKEDPDNPVILLPLLRHLLDSYLLLSLAEEKEDIDEDLLLNKENLQFFLNDKVKAFILRFAPDVKDIVADS